MMPARSLDPLSTRENRITAKRNLFLTAGDAQHARHIHLARLREDGRAWRANAKPFRRMDLETGPIGEPEQHYFYDVFPQKRTIRAKAAGSASAPNE